MKRKITMLLAVLCLLVSMPIASYAATPNAPMAQSRASGGMQPYFINASNISAGLIIDGNIAYCNGDVTAKKKCSVSIVMRLQRKEGNSWHTVSSWITSSNTGYKTITRSFTLTTRGSYRTYCLFDVAGEELDCASVTKTY
ncbi:MAG: hypothetical protein K1V96_04720 [Lachnospiraceae bacterium]